MSLGSKSPVLAAFVAVAVASVDGSALADPTDRENPNAPSAPPTADSAKNPAEPAAPTEPAGPPPAGDEASAGSAASKAADESPQADDSDAQGHDEHADGPDASASTHRTGQDQHPPPYLLTAPPERPLLNVELGATAGMSFRGASGSLGDSVDYGPGRFIGAYARIHVDEIWRVRLAGSREWLPLSVSATSPFSEVDPGQSDLTGVQLTARVEPSWQVTDVLSLWAGAGIGWARFVAEPYESHSGLRSLERSGVCIELPLTAGISAELMQHWLVISLHGQWGPLVQQSGTLFETTQAIDADGQLGVAPRLPKFSNPAQLALSLGVLL